MQANATKIGLKNSFSAAILATFTALMAVATQAAVDPGARNLPTDGKVMYIMGQDTTTLRDYKRDVLDSPEHADMPAPSGVTLYSSMLDVSLQANSAPGDADLYVVGIEGPPYDNSNGESDFRETLDAYDAAYGGKVALTIGLYLSDEYAQGDARCANQPLRAIIDNGDQDIGSASDPNSLSYQWRYAIDRKISWLKAEQRPVFLRIGYEFDGPWNCYSQDFYKQAFRYIKERIDALDATNIATVWQAATYPDNGSATFNYDVASNPNHYADWYPGNDVVDWVGVSFFSGSEYLNYQWSCQDSSKAWTVPDISPRQLQDNLVNFAAARNKPVLIAESAPQGFELGALEHSCVADHQVGKTFNNGEQAYNAFFTDFFNWISTNREQVRGFSYINTDWQNQDRWKCPSGTIGCPAGFWGDTRIQANADVLNLFKQEVSKSMYAVSGTTTGTSTGTGSNTDTTTDTGTNTNSNTDTQTSTGTDTSTGTQGEDVRIEAESGSISGDAQIYDDNAASGNQGVAYIYTQGSGFTLSNVPASNALTLTYASENSGTISVYVNGVDNNVSFVGSGSWVSNYSTVRLETDIPAGANVTVQWDNGDSALNADFITFHTVVEPTDTDTATATDTGSDTSTDSSTATDTDTNTSTDTGSDTGTATDTGSTTDTGSDTGTDTVVEPSETPIEAESGSITGDAQVYNDSSASSGQGVAYIYSSGSGFTINNAPAADSIEIVYASQNSGAISIFVAGTKYSVPFNSTGAWVGTYNTVTLENVTVSAGDTVSLEWDNGDAALNVDYLNFKQSGTVVDQPVNQAPSVSINAPSGLVEGDSMTVSANASDSDGSVASVAFYATAPGSSETLISTDSNAPFNATIDNLAVGTYALRAVATDNDGSTAEATTSATVAAAPVTDTDTGSATDTGSTTDTGTDTATDTGTVSGGFGIDANGMLFHANEGWTAEWQYLCLNGDCRPGTLNNGRYERAVEVTVGTTYNIEFKVQDDSLSQCLSGVQAVTYASGGVTAPSECTDSVASTGTETTTDTVTDTDSTTDTGTATDTGSDTGTDTGTDTPAKSYLMSIGFDSTVGRFLIGGRESGIWEGYSLYVFDNDLSAPGTSQCNGGCADVWPALTVADASEITVDAAVSGFGTITRNDQSLQVTYQGRPLYFFANDNAPGDINGQGANGVWWLAELPEPAFADNTWEKSNIPACAAVYNNVPAWGAHTFVEGNTVTFRASPLLADRVWASNARAVFFRNDVEGRLEHLGTIESPKNGNTATFDFPAAWNTEGTVFYVSYERVVAPLQALIGDALAYQDSPLFGLGKGCHDGAYNNTNGEKFAGWMRFQHPQGFFNDHSVFNERIDPNTNSAGHFRNVPRYTISVVQDEPGKDLIMQVDLFYESYSTNNATKDVTWSAIEGSEMRAGGGSPRQSVSQICELQGPGGNTAICNLGQFFSYGQNIDWELRVIPTNSNDFNLYSQMLFYSPGIGWQRESSDPRALLGGYESMDAFGANEYERAAAFQQHAHSDDLQFVRDFVEQHEDVRVPIGTDLQPGFTTCESCHVNDGRSQVAFEVPNVGTLIAPPLIGLGLLERVQFEGKAGFGWRGNKESVEAAVRSALNVDFGVSNPSATMVQRLTNYSQQVAVPQRDKSKLFDPQVLAGEALFKGEMGCVGCHTESQITADGNVFRPYTDLLTHDMGDGTFRTAPLWGIGRAAEVEAFSLDMEVNGLKNVEQAVAQRQSLPTNELETLFMHDGRAKGLDAAVRAHGGAGADSAAAYESATQAQRDQLLAFLRSL